MPVKTKFSGPLDAKIMVVGEAPGADEEIAGVPFVGTSGTELTKMLNEAGILRSECFLTNVCKYRPPENKIENFFLDKKRTKPNEYTSKALLNSNRRSNLSSQSLYSRLGILPSGVFLGRTVSPSGVARCYLTAPLCSCQLIILPTFFDSGSLEASLYTISKELPRLIQEATDGPGITPKS